MRVALFPDLSFVNHCAIVNGIFGTRPYYQVQGALAEIVESGIAYTSICYIFTLGIYFHILFERMLQATGPCAVHKQGKIIPILFPMMGKGMQVVPFGTACIIFIWEY